MPTKCRENNAQGEPCKADHYREGYCRWHHPEFKSKHREISSKGGKARSNAARASKHLKQFDLTDVDAILCTTLEGVLGGKIEPGVANSAANVARAINQVRSATEVERRLVELEELLKGGRIA